MASFPTITIIPSICLILLSGWFCINGDANGVVKVPQLDDNDDKTLTVVENQREFDYFLLALQWPGTYCRNTHKCCSQNGCCRGSNSPSGFTIHGLWTDYNDGTWPSCCNGPAFDEKEISTLLDGLNKYWPSLSCSKSSTCHGKKGIFWAHEWEKHGTCSYPVLQGEYNYFLTTLNLYFTYNVTEILSEAGYVASSSEKYPLGGIISAVQNSFHATPEIICSGGALEELRLCFYKDFTPRDCDATSSLKGVLYSSSCSEYVSLPAYASMGFENNGTTRSWLTGKSSI